jgi:hypothetical protein
MLGSLRAAPRFCGVTRWGLRSGSIQQVHYARHSTIADSTSSATGSGSISMAHPRDPGPSSQLGPATSNDSDQPSSPSPSPPPTAEAESQPSANESIPVPFILRPEHSNDPPEPSNLPLPQAPRPSSYTNPSFDTYRFFAALEKTFPTPTARSLMRATRALLVDKIGRVRKEALTVKDLESVRILRLNNCIFALKSVPKFSKHTCSKLLCLSYALSSPCVRGTNRLQ